MCLTICGVCRKEVRSHGVLANRLVDYVINYCYSHKKAPSLDELALDGISFDDKILRDLELSRIIITTENGLSSLVVMPRGLNVIDDATVLCRRDHV